jgi:hypothetical protein
MWYVYYKIYYKSSNSNNNKNKTTVITHGKVVNYPDSTKERITYFPLLNDIRTVKCFLEIFWTSVEIRYS